MKAGIHTLVCQCSQQHIHRIQKVETTQVPSDKWMSKKHVVCPYSNYYSALKGNETLIPATLWMNLKKLMLTEISQTRQSVHDSNLHKAQGMGTLIRTKYNDVEGKERQRIIL